MEKEKSTIIPLLTPPPTKKRLPFFGFGYFAAFVRPQLWQNSRKYSTNMEMTRDGGTEEGMW